MENLVYYKKQISVVVLSHMASDTQEFLILGERNSLICLFNSYQVSVIVQNQLDLHRAMF